MDSFSGRYGATILSECLLLVRPTTSISGESQPPMVLDLKVIGTAGSHPLHAVVRRGDDADAAWPIPNE